MTQPCCVRGDKRLKRISIRIENWRWVKEKCSPWALRVTREVWKLTPVQGQKGQISGTTNKSLASAPLDSCPSLRSSSKVSLAVLVIPPWLEWQRNRPQKEGKAVSALPLHRLSSASHSHECKANNWVPLASLLPWLMPRIPNTSHKHTHGCTHKRDHMLPF